MGAALQNYTTRVPKHAVKRAWKAYCLAHLMAQPAGLPLTDCPLFPEEGGAADRGSRSQTTTALRGRTKKEMPWIDIRLVQHNQPYIGECSTSGVHACRKTREICQPIPASPRPRY